MTNMFRITTVLLSLGGIGSAYADEAESTRAGARSIETTTLMAQANIPNVPSLGVVNPAVTVESPAPRADRRSWVFPPLGNYLPR